MPAALPGSAGVKNDASNTYPSNPSTGQAILMDPLSGPKGSPLDMDKDMVADGTKTANANCSTGALCTGIGFGLQDVFGLTAPTSITAAGFDDDYVPGTTPAARGTANTVSSTYMYIGGGRSATLSSPAYAPVAGVAGTNPYTAGVMLLGAGNGGSRDAGAGPAFTGFSMKTVTASGAVATGAAVETGFLNRTGAAMTTGQSTFGSSNSASATPA